MNATRICSFDGCGRRHLALGLCGVHYGQQRRGVPLTPIREKRLSVADRLDRDADKSGDCWLWTLTLDDDGYGSLNIGGTMKLVHRVAYECAYGPIPAGAEVDHRCHVRHCINPAHLQAVTHQRNTENRAGATAFSRSGVRGVVWVAQMQKWRASVKHQGIRHHAGYFDDLADAEVAAIAKRNELFTNNLADR